MTDHASLQYAKEDFSEDLKQVELALDLWMCRLEQLLAQRSKCTRMWICPDVGDWTAD